MTQLLKPIRAPVDDLGLGFRGLGFRVTQHAQVRYLQAAAGCSASSRFGFNGPQPFNACQITENTHRPEGLNP